MCFLLMLYNQFQKLKVFHDVMSILVRRNLRGGGLGLPHIPTKLSGDNSKTLTNAITYTKSAISTTAKYVVLE